MRIAFLTCILFLSLSTAAQTSWYVDQEKGSASNDGKNPNSAFNAFDLALDNVQPGDTIFIIGEYHNASYDPDYTYGLPDDAQLWNGENSINVSGLHGTESARITITSYKGFPDRPAVIRGDGANLFRVRNSSYLIIKELELEGEVNRIPLSTAEALQFVYIIADENLTGTLTDPAPEDIKHRDEEGSDPSGIYPDETYPDISTENVKRPSYVDTRGLYMSAVDHIEITGNIIHHTPGVGLRVADGKYITISGNEVHNCSRKSYSGTHALVVTKTHAVADGDTAVLISNNKVHHNYNEIFSWTPAKTIINPRIDEGKGISLQRNNTDEWLNGGGRIIVVNNICYWNGYAGVHSNGGHRIDFINNTCFMNSYTNTVTYAGTDMQAGNNIGISAQGGADIKMINNISVVDADWGGYALSAGGVASGLIVENNIIFGMNGTVSTDPDVNAVEENTKIADPMFVDAPAGYRDENYGFDLRLKEGSQAIDFALKNYAPETDFYGKKRDRMPDAGAIEYLNQSGIEDNIYGSIKVYPTFFSNEITVEWQTNGKMHIGLFDLSGKVIFRETVRTGERKIRIYAGYLKRGGYLLKAGNRSFKLIKK
jgi:hypothetical protein